MGSGDHRAQPRLESILYSLALLSETSLRYACRNSQSNYIQQPGYADGADIQKSPFRTVVL